MGEIFRGQSGELSLKGGRGCTPKFRQIYRQNKFLPRGGPLPYPNAHRTVKRTHITLLQCSRQALHLKTGLIGLLIALRALQPQPIRSQVVDKLQYCKLVLILHFQSEVVHSLHFCNYGNPKTAATIV